MSYLDNEVQKILERRDFLITKEMNRYEVYGLGVRAAAGKRLKEEAKMSKEEAKNAPQSKVSRMQLESDGTCCVCYEIMAVEENLTYCEVGCGRNIHTECMERWVKHK